MRENFEIIVAKGRTKTDQTVLNHTIFAEFWHFHSRKRRHGESDGTAPNQKDTQAAAVKILAQTTTLFAVLFTSRGSSLLAFDFLKTQIAGRVISLVGNVISIF